MNFQELVTPPVELAFEGTGQSAAEVAHKNVNSPLTSDAHLADGADTVELQEPLIHTLCVELVHTTELSNLVSNLHLTQANGTCLGLNLGLGLISQPLTPYLLTFYTGGGTR
jgi:hypothetical protein